MRYVFIVGFMFGMFLGCTFGYFVGTIDKEGKKERITHETWNDNEGIQHNKWTYRGNYNH